MEPRVEPLTPDVDPMVVDAVTNVRDRFGAEGLRDLIALARADLAEVERAERELAAAVNEPKDVPAAPQYDSADTQAWLAYTEAEPRGDSRDGR